MGLLCDALLYPVMMLRAIYHTPGSSFAMLQYDLLFAMSQGFTSRSFAVVFGLVAVQYSLF